MNRPIADPSCPFVQNLLRPWQRHSHAAQGHHQYLIGFPSGLPPKTEPKNRSPNRPPHTAATIASTPIKTNRSCRRPGTARLHRRDRVGSHNRSRRYRRLLPAASREEFSVALVVAGHLGDVNLANRWPPPLQECPHRVSSCIRRPESAKWAHQQTMKVEEGGGSTRLPGEYS